MIRCYTPQGQAVTVDPRSITFSPAVYGILVENDQVLLVVPQNRLLHPPGGILNNRETPDQAVRSFFRHFVGITPLLGPLVFMEDQYRVDEEGDAWHLSVMYYALERPSGTVITPLDATSLYQPEWFPLATLQREKLQLGYEAIQAAWLRLKL